MKRVDINCDMGEGFGPWPMGRDEELLDIVTSANIACGWHAGDASTMRRTVRAALQRGVAIGAHPGLPDRAGFGRRRMELTPGEVYDAVVYQVGALLGTARAAGATLAHVKPHGALYNMAAADAALADAVAAAVRDIDDSLILFGLAGSALIAAADAIGLRSAAEVFADRSYEPDGTLTPRSRGDALIDDAAVAAERAVRMVVERTVAARDGSTVELRADTMCVHGDGAHALEIARALRRALDAAGVTVAPPG